METKEFTRDWYAWINFMPPKPDEFHAVGEVLVGNPGVQAELCARESGGSSATTLLLDLHLVQRPGMWPQVVTWVQCRYQKVLTPGKPKYDSVEVFYDGASIAKIEVDEVH